jgi:hypothetical protein
MNRGIWTAIALFVSQSAMFSGLNLAIFGVSRLRLEGLGAVNLLDLDEIAVTEEDEPVDPRSFVSLPVKDGRPVRSAFWRPADDPFLQQVNASGRKWVIITDVHGQPQRVLGTHRFARDSRATRHSLARGAPCFKKMINSLKYA